MDGFISAFARRRATATDAGRWATTTDRDIPFYWNVADNYVLFDRFFTSAVRRQRVEPHVLGRGRRRGTRPEDASRPTGFGDLTTIFDRLEAAGHHLEVLCPELRPDDHLPDLSTAMKRRGARSIWVPLLAYAALRRRPEAASPRSWTSEQYYRDLRQRDAFPPSRTSCPSGASEHPPGSITAGRSLRPHARHTPLMRSTRLDSPRRSCSSYDDWGGWYDHVAPPQVDQFGYGFRVPALLVSPYATPGLRRLARRSTSPRS